MKETRLARRDGYAPYMNKQTAFTGSPPPPSPASFPLPTHQVTPRAAAAPASRPGNLLLALSKGALAWLPQELGGAVCRDTIPSKIPAPIPHLPHPGALPADHQPG